MNQLKGEDLNQSKEKKLQKVKLRRAKNCLLTKTAATKKNKNTSDNPQWFVFPHLGKKNSRNLITEKNFATFPNFVVINAGTLTDASLNAGGFGTSCGPVPGCDQQHHLAL